MTLADSAQGSPLFQRVQAILMRPKQEWQVIDGETTTTSDLYRRYVAPLAAVPAVAQLIGGVVFGYGLGPIGSIRVSIGSAITQAIVTYALTLVGIYVFALIIDALATNFGGTKNSMQALKVAAYSSTAQWVAGVFLVLPALGFLSILGVYSLYLLYLGMPVLMRAPQERALTYTIAVVVVGIVITFVIAAIAGSFTAGLI